MHTVSINQAYPQLLFYLPGRTGNGHVFIAKIKIILNVQKPCIIYFRSEKGFNC